LLVQTDGFSYAVDPVVIKTAPNFRQFSTASAVCLYFRDSKQISTEMNSKISLEAWALAFGGKI
jgi:hypothetical protein